MYRLCLLVLLGVWQASAQLTTPAPGLSVDCNAVGIQNCDSCDMPGLTCALCPINAAISDDFRTCTACDVNCVDCALDKNDKPVCSMCAIGFILKSDGTCMSCGSWCNFCTFVDATQAKVQCTQCAPSVINYLLGPVSKACQDCTLVSSGCISCSEATDLTLTCTACGPSFYYDSTSKSCTPCPNNCQACSMIKAVLTCTSCRTGYILNNNAAQLTTTSFACLSYDPLRCKATGTASTVITTASTCSSCLPGYYLDSSNLCQYCPEGCLTCTSASACQTCSPAGYYLDKASSKCMACSWGCNSCTVSNNVQTCSSCMAGFGLQSTGSVSCQYCPANCASCSDPATCDTCDSWSAAYPYGFALVVTARGTECLECPDHCSFSGCTDDSFGGVECTDCGSGRVNAYDADGYSICIPCSQNCDTCTYDENFGTTTCITCVSNQYYVAADGTCKSCASNCVDCTGADDTCLACAKGYFLDTSGTNPKCTKCATANCDYCDFANNCTTCTPGYYLDPLTVTCKFACDSNCICSDSSNLCTACLVTMTAADDAPYNFYDLPNTQCLYCDINCAFGGCGADGECTTCIDGYVPDTNGKCTQCDIHCLVGASCTYTTSAQCSACEDGYYVNAGKCSKCSTGCMTCPAGVCSACFSDYVSNGASPAVTCYANDAHCAAGSSVYDSAKKKSLCNNCENYYTALNGVCTANPTGCLIGTLDSTETFVICDTCDNGYGKVIATSMCSPCPVNCASCTQNSVTLLMECDVCESDAVENKNPCGLCPYGCTACRNVAGSMFCSACAVGYYLDTKAGDCVACTSCSSCTASGCNAGTCFAGFGLSTDGFCTDCSTLTTVSGCSNCTDVDSTGMSKCLDCSGNQVLDGWGSFCQDFSTLTNCEVPEFRAFECAFGKCTSPFSWVLEGPGRGMCGLTCAVCGDIDAGIYLPESECQNSANNYTEAQVVGACWVSRMEDSQGNVLYARGGTMQFNCTSDHQEEFTSPYDSAYTFKCCQSGDGCSDSLTLDGQDGAAAISFSLALLFASILVSLRLF